jgi:hypothetical protein
MTAWHRGHMPIGRLSLTASKLALVDIVASNNMYAPARRKMKNLSKVSEGQH